MLSLPAALLKSVEGTFYATFLAHGTEERILIYASPEGELHPVRQDGHRKRDEVYFDDVPMAIERNGSIWGLAYDLHSHHIMGAFWSRKDNTNERLPGIIFGVFSWNPGRSGWLFRRWERGGGFRDLTREEVVDLG